MRLNVQLKQVGAATLLASLATAMPSYGGVIYDADIAGRGIDQANDTLNGELGDAYFTRFGDANDFSKVKIGLASPNPPAFVQVAGNAAAGLPDTSMVTTDEGLNQGGLTGNLDPTDFVAGSIVFDWTQTSLVNHDAEVRVVVQVGGAYYASATQFLTTGNGLEAKTLTFDATAANWLVVDENNNGQTGAIAGADLAGPITQWGLQSNSDQGPDDKWLRFTEYTISATPVPEPGSLALMGLGGLMIARRRRV